MGQWTFFAGLYGTLITPNITALLAMVGRVCATAQPIALALIAIWFVLAMFELSAGTKTLPTIFKEGFVTGLVFGFLQEAEFTQYIVNLVTQGVPNTIGTAMGGQGSPVSALDNLLAAAITEVSKVYEALPAYSLKTIPLGCAAIVAMGVSAIAIAFCFGIYVVAALINIGALVVGPIFLALAASPHTRRYAMGWVAVLVGGCTTELMALAILQLLSAGEMNLIRQAAANAAASNSNAIAMLWSLCQIGLLLYLSKKIIEEIPVVARTIGGGVYAAASNAAAHGLTFGLAGAAVGAAAGAARGAAIATATRGASAGMSAIRAAAPVGRSLSSGA